MVRESNILIYGFKRITWTVRRMGWTGARRKAGGQLEVNYNSSGKR